VQRRARLKDLSAPATQHSNHSENRGIARKKILSATVLGISADFLPGAGLAGTLTHLSFISNGGAFGNDTVVGNGTWPLAFTATGGLNQPFLNAADSPISLGYGTYYAIAFRGFGSHVGTGVVSFLLDGTTAFSSPVTFPDPTAASGVFASFAMPGGNAVTVSATGLSADRIRIVADGGGLVADSVPDAFYLFTYSSGQTRVIPLPAAGWLLAGGLAFMGFGRRLLVR